MDLVSVSPVFTFTTLPGRSAPGAPVSAGKICLRRSGRMGVCLDSIVAGGSVISVAAFKNPYRNNVRVNSYSEVSDSIIYNHVNVAATRASAALSSIATHLPSAPRSATTRSRPPPFHVSDSGIVVVVRQESLIEEPESA